MGATEAAWPKRLTSRRRGPARRHRRSFGPTFVAGIHDRGDPVKNLNDAASAPGPPEKNPLTSGLGIRPGRN